MLEAEAIQYRGFRNLEKDGKTIGFQVCVRSMYYRGVWLSQLRPGRLIVDGEVFPWDTIIWEINGVDYTPAEMAQRSDRFWRNTEPAVLKVTKEGGLKQGFHDITVRFGVSCSYMPPEIDRFDDNTEMTSFFGGTYTKNSMIIV